MHKTCRFLTGSSYDGLFQRSVNTMDGFGRYTYPDGSEYLGFFKKSRFHGYGRLKLGKPYNFTYKGEFSNGHLVTIEEMSFADGLLIDGTINDDALDTSRWIYCTDKDRRYARELRWGIEPVGPTASLTKWRQPRELPPKCYDTEEGIFSDHTGFIKNRPLPLNLYRFVGCDREREWIMKNCRKSKERNIVEPEPTICQRIIESNKANEEQPAHYTGFVKSERVRYITQVCTENPSSELFLIERRQLVPSKQSAASMKNSKRAKTVASAMSVKSMGSAGSSQSDSEIDYDFGKKDTLSLDTIQSHNFQTPTSRSTSSFSDVTLQQPARTVMDCSVRKEDQSDPPESDIRTSILQTYRASYMGRHSKKSISK